jgi:hypothetical protein
MQFPDEKEIAGNRVERGSEAEKRIYAKGISSGGRRG